MEKNSTIEFFIGFPLSFCIISLKHFSHQVNRTGRTCYNWQFVKAPSKGKVQVHPVDQALTGNTSSRLI